jgi:dienelactone hydrolase
MKRIALGCLFLLACAGDPDSVKTVGTGASGGEGGGGGTLTTGGSGGASTSGGVGGASTTGGEGGGGGASTGGASGTGAMGGQGGSFDAAVIDGPSIADAESDRREGSVEAGAGCAAMTSLPVPEDPTVRGPWPVGVRTVSIGRLAVEVIYPGAPGSETGTPEATYDVRAWLPERERSKVPDANSPAVKPIGGRLFRDLPIDAEHGPYPVVFFVHGTASFRIASASTMTHWASRGFVVVAADYPGMFLADMLASTLECLLPTTGLQDVPGDINTQIQALSAPSGSLAFLAGRVDMTRVGLSGHSQGACITATLSTLANVRIVLPMAGSAPVAPSSSLRALMYIGGIDDKVIGYNAPLIGNVVCPLFSTSDTAAYQASPGPPAVTKRLAGIAGGGHLVMTDLCQTNALGRNAIQEAQADGVCGINSAVIIGLPALFDCGTIDMASGINAVNYATTAALEEALMCKDRSAQFANIKTSIPSITDFQEAK